MNVNPLQRPVSAADIAPEKLAGNTHLTEAQKIDEASRQFEAVLVRQILSDSQKTVIKSEFSDSSTASGIYQDLITNTLAGSITKSGGFGLAKTFSRQLNRPAERHAGAGGTGSNPADSALPTVRNAAVATPIKHPGGAAASRPGHGGIFSVQQP